MNDKSDSTPILVSPEVLEGLEAVRLSGLTNMLDRPAVSYIAGEMGYEEAATWVTGHPDLFARGVFRGFEPEEPST